MQNCLCRPTEDNNQIELIRHKDAINAHTATRLDFAGLSSIPSWRNDAIARGNREYVELKIGPNVQDRRACLGEDPPGWGDR
jgi:hypothetical protein